MRLFGATALTLCACVTTQHDARRDAMSNELARHLFAMSLEQAQATLLKQTTWPGQPFGTFSVKLEAQAAGKGHVRIPVTITNQLTTGRPSDLAVIELAQEGDGVRAFCSYEQNDADCADWVWSTLSADGLEDARQRAGAASDKVIIKQQHRERRRIEKAVDAQVTGRGRARRSVQAVVGGLVSGRARGGRQPRRRRGGAGAARRRPAAALTERRDGVSARVPVHRPQREAGRRLGEPAGAPRSTSSSRC